MVGVFVKRSGCFRQSCRKNQQLFPARPAQASPAWRNGRSWSEERPHLVGGAAAPGNQERPAPVAKKGLHQLPRQAFPHKIKTI